MKRHQVDAALVQHGQELFWPRAQRGPDAGALKLPGRRGQAGGSGGGGVTAGAVRQRVRLVVSGAPPVRVKITGASTGMGKVRQHLRYITERGEVLRDDQGREYATPEDVRLFGDHFQVEGSFIPSEGGRRESLQLALDMPAGTDPEAVQAAAVEFAEAEFAGHRWAWVYHGHQEHPHVHMIVRIEGRNLQRLNPGPADLHRWRERFAQGLRARGVPAQGTSRLVRGSVRNAEPLWVTRARKAGTLRQEPPLSDRVTHASEALQRTLKAWAYIHAALAASPDEADRELAAQVKAFVKHMPMVSHVVGVELDRQRQPERQVQEPGPGR
jgi:hypothetical protein